MSDEGREKDGKKYGGAGQSIAHLPEWYRDLVKTI